MKAKYQFSNLRQVNEVAKAFVAEYGHHKVVAFYGEMGVGKTTLIKAICSEMGIRDIVNSPTFSIVNEYVSDSGEVVYHFDFYRIETLDEALDMGCDDYFYSGRYCLIEWPENVESLLPSDMLSVTINLLENKSREIFIA